VTAAPVIPAPIAYIKVVAVKKLVVGNRNDHGPGLPGWRVLAHSFFLPVSFFSLLTERLEKLWIVYFEKIRGFKAGFIARIH